MKKSSLAALSAALVIFLSGCTQSGFVKEHQPISCNMPSDREVELCFTNISNNFDTTSVHITAEGMAQHDRALGSASVGSYPVDTVTGMLGIDSVEELWDTYGQPYKYHQEGGISVVIFRDRLFYDAGAGCIEVSLADVEPVSIDGSELTPPEGGAALSIQCVGDSIFLLSREASGSAYGAVVTEIGISKECVINSTFIPFSVLGLPEVKAHTLAENMFITDGTLFFSVNDYGDNSWIAAYDLESGEGTSVQLSDVAYDGKLFSYNGGVGAFVSDYDEEGYNTYISLRFFSYDGEQCVLTESTAAEVTLPEEGYFFGTSGSEFYCIDDTLCGIVHHIDNGMIAYTEISLPSGSVATFMPFEISSDRHYIDGYLITDGGVAPRCN